MKKYTATIVTDLQMPLPSLTEIKVFVWNNYFPPDIDLEELWDREYLSIEHFGQGNGSVKFSIIEEELRIIKASSLSEKMLARAVYAVATMTKGIVFYGAEKLKMVETESLIEIFGEDFDLSYASQRLERMIRRLPDYFEKHMPVLKDYVPGRLSTFSIKDRKSLNGRSTHPESAISNWVSKGSEGYMNFAADPNVPDNFWACLFASYPSQEWIFVLWKRNNRRFWFGAPNFHLYNDDRTTNQAVKDLEKALHFWNEEDGNVFFMEGDKMSSEVKSII